MDQLFATDDALPINRHASPRIDSASVLAPKSSHKQ